MCLPNFILFHSYESKRCPNWPEWFSSELVWIRMIFRWLELTNDGNSSLKSGCIMLLFISVGGWSESVPVSMWDVVCWLIRLLVLTEELKSAQLGSERLDRLKAACKMSWLQWPADTDLNTTVKSMDKGTAFSGKEHESKILINQPGFPLEHGLHPFSEAVPLSSLTLSLLVLFCLTMTLSFCVLWWTLLVSSSLYSCLKHILCNMLYFIHLCMHLYVSAWFIIHSFHS